MHQVKRPHLTAGIALLVLLTLAGCASTPATPADPPAGTNRPTETPAASPSPAAEPDTRDTRMAKFGDTYEWSDGIAMTVSAPEPYEPSETAAFDESAAYLLFTITLVNGSDKPHDPTMVYPTVQSGNVEATTVYDSENGIGGGPSTDVLPGRESMWEVAFGVQDPEDLVFEVSPGFEHQPIYFTTTGS
jgi:hypothetical protein